MEGKQTLGVTTGPHFPTHWVLPTLTSQTWLFQAQIFTQLSLSFDIIFLRFKIHSYGPNHTLGISCGTKTLSLPNHKIDVYQL